MTKRFNITAITSFDTKDGETKKAYARCGSAFLNTTKDGAKVINLKFDFIPTAAPGAALEIACFEPKTDGDQDE